MMELRPLNDNDIPMVEKWLNKEHVKIWYNMPRIGVTIDDWMREIRERHGKYKWINYLIVIWEGQPIGLCQYYKCEESDEENFSTLKVSGAYGIDYLIGEETMTGKGLGKKMIAALVQKIFTFPDAERITADLDQNNIASEKVLFANGFVMLSARLGRYVLEKP